MSPREEIQKKLIEELESNSKYWNAPYGILEGNHSCLDDAAVVFPSDLEKELKKINPNWYADNFNLTKKD